MAEDLAHKKKIRGGHRAYVTKVINKSKDILSNYDATLHREKIQQFRLTLRERSDIIKSLDATILDAVKDTEIDTEIEESGELAN